MERNKQLAIHAKEIAEKRLLKQDYSAHNSSSNLNRANKWRPQQQPQPQPHQQFTFWTKCPGCEYRHQYHHNVLSHEVCCTHCSKNFVANALSHLIPGCIDGGWSPQQITETNSAHNSSGNINSANKCCAQQQPQPQPHQQFTFWIKCPGCEYRHQYHGNVLSQEVCCMHCSKNFVASALFHLNPGHIDGGRSPQQITETNSSHNSSGNINSANKCLAQKQRQLQPHLGLTFWTECPNCGTLPQYHSNILYQIVCCTHCSKSFRASAASHLKPGHMDGGRNEGQQFTSLRQPQKSDTCRFTCDRGVRGTTRNITEGVRKLDSNPNPTSMSNSSSQTLLQGRISDREETDGGAHAAGTITPLRRSPCNKPDFKNNAEPGCPNPAKMARAKVKGVRDGNSCANAANTNTIASTGVEGVVKGQERDGEKERVEPSGFLKKNNTDFKPSGSAEDKGATYKKARFEVNGVPDDNGSANATNTNTRATTCVEGEMRGQDREKEKGTEQLEPSGFLKEKETAFNPSASAEGSGTTYKKARVEVNGMPEGNGSANATNTNTRASSRAKGEAKEQDGEKEKEQVEPSGLLAKGDTACKPSGSADDNCTTSKKARLEVEGVQVGNGNTDTANTSASTLVEGKVKEPDRRKDRIFTDNAFPHLKPGNQPQQFTGQQQPQQSDSYIFTYVRRVRGTTRDNAGGVRKPDENCLSMSKSNNPNTVNGQRAKNVSADTSQNPNPCSKSNLSLDVNQRRGDAEGTDGGNHVAGSSRPLTRSSSNYSDVEYNGTGVSSPAKKARGEVKGERDGDSASTSRYLRRSSRYKPDVKHIDTCVSSPAMKPNDDAENLYVYPDPEFHKFEMCRTCSKFQQGNIWALYSDLDTFPKYYGLIRKVEHEPFKVHINWLKACPKSDVERAWLSASLPISCGKFWVTTQNTIYDKPEFFSHIVSVRHHVRGNYFDILPGVGEIWAVYKNWSARWTCRDFKTCKFDIVEVREQREDSTMVWPLRQVPEFKSVFMPEQDNGTGSGTYKVPASAYILFSHKIPAIRLTDECGGKLKGFWELDPASLPILLT